MLNPSDGRLELRVSDLVPSDMSNYTCQSRNKAGFHEKNGTITVNCESCLICVLRCDMLSTASTGLQGSHASWNVLEFVL